MDGEGYLGIHARTKRATGRTYYASRAMLGMTTPALPVLTEFRETWGGSLSLVRPGTTVWADAWAWTLQGAPLVTFLSLIEPHLRIKREQALTLLELEKLRDSLPRQWGGSRPEWTDETLAYAQTLKERIHALNMKGPARSAEVP